MRLQDEEAVSKGISRSMAPEDIARRLRIAGELYEAARILSSARRLGPVEPSGEAEDDHLRSPPRPEK